MPASAWRRPAPPATPRHTMRSSRRVAGASIPSADWFSSATRARSWTQCGPSESKCLTILCQQRIPMDWYWWGGVERRGVKTVRENLMTWKTYWRRTREEGRMKCAKEMKEHKTQVMLLTVVFFTFLRGYHSTNGLRVVSCWD